MFHLSRKTARATLLAIGLLVLLVLLAACGSVSPKLLSNSLQDATSYNPQEAGYLTGLSDLDLHGSAFTSAEVQFTVQPLVDLTNIAPGAKVAYGAWLRDYQSRISLDAGIYSYKDPATGSQVNQAYWEFYDPNHPGLTQSEPFSLYSLTTGEESAVSKLDQILVVVTSNYDANGNGADFFSVTDLTTNAYGNFRLPGPDYMLTPHQAGCIVLRARDTAPNTYVPMANFGTVTFTGCQAAPSGSPPEALINLQPNHIEMAAGTTLYTSIPTPIGNDGQSFSVTWQNP